MWISIFITLFIYCALSFKVYSQNFIKTELDSLGYLNVIFTSTEKESVIYIEKKIEHSWIILDSTSYMVMIIEPQQVNQLKDQSYTLNLPLDKGKNSFRLNVSGESTILEINSMMERNFDDYRNKDFINFEVKTNYSLRDANGSYIQSGYVPFINIKKLPKGEYYLRINNDPQQPLLRG